MQDLISNTINWVQQLQPGAQSAFSTSVVQVGDTPYELISIYPLPLFLFTQVIFFLPRCRC